LVKDRQGTAAGGLFRGQGAFVARTPWTPGLAVAATLAIIGAGIVAGAVAGGGATSWMRLGSPESAALVTLGAWQGVAILLTLGAARAFGGHPGEVLALVPPRGSPRVYFVAVLLLAGLNLSVSVVQYWPRTTCWPTCAPSCRS